jgi:hypothetical protein
LQALLQLSALPQVLLALSLRLSLQVSWLPVLRLSLRVSLELRVRARPPPSPAQHL